MGQCVPASTPNGGGNGGSGGGGSGGGGGTGTGGNGASGGGAGCGGCAAPARRAAAPSGAILVVFVFGLGARRWRFTMRR